MIDDKATVTCTTDSKNFNAFYGNVQEVRAYGGLEIDITKDDNASMIHSWTFQVMCESGYKDALFGVCNQHPRAESLCMAKVRVMHNDIVRMDFDIEQGELRLYLNDKPGNYADPARKWRFTKEGRMWRMLASVRQKGTMIKLVKFDQRRASSCDRKFF